VTETLIQYIEWGAAVAAVWGPFLIFFFMTVESSFVPFPSEVIMIPAGFLAARGAMPLGDPASDMAIAIFMGVLGSLAGAYINYFLFRWLGKPFLEKNGKYFGLSPAKLHRAEEIFREYGAGATFVCRLLPAIRQLISIPAGIARMKLTTFTWCTALGAGIWVIVLTWIGYYIGTHTRDITYADLVHQGKALIAANYIWIILFAVGFSAVYIYVHKLVMHGRKRPAA
jgi:membrane protein DedA with SNARE-associated domain